MIEIIANNRRLAERRAVLIVIPDIHHAFLRRVFPDFLIQRFPVRAALFRIDLMIQIIQFRMMRMDPVKDSALIISPQIEVFQPHQVALTPGALDDGDHVREAGEDRRNEAGGLNTRLIELPHGFQPALNAHGTVHFLTEALVHRVDRPGHVGAGKLPDQVQVAQDQIRLRGNADADPGPP